MRSILRQMSVTVVLLTACLLVSPPTANAQSQVAQPQQSPSDNKTEAKTHFEQGKVAFSRGQYEDALNEYTVAYRLLPLPGFLFNIGQCYRNLEQYEKAILSFQLYLQNVPQAANRNAVQQLVKELEDKLEQKRSTEEKIPAENEKLVTKPFTEPPSEITKINEPLPLEPPPPTPMSTSITTPIYKKWWFWTAIAVAVGGGAVGAYYGIRSTQGLPSSDFPTWDLSR
ncbi:MAG: tetratricopeptide repeat protein [Pseudomonadota bacterium]